MKKTLSLLSVLCLCASLAQAAKPVKALVSEVKGKAYINTGSGWKKCYSMMPVNENSSIKTEPRSKVTILMDDRSRIQMKANSHMKLNSLSGTNRAVELQKGRSVFKMSRMWGGRKFQCKTPVAVCSVRGTEFSVEVGEDKKSSFKVFSGLVDISDNDGKKSVSLNRNEKLDVSENVPMGSPTPFSVSDNKEKADISRAAIAYQTGLEVSNELSKEAVQKAAADELRLAEYQQGKTIIDAFGQRVKIQEYIIRTALNEFKMVVLNERDDRFDYFTNTQTYNDTLPSDLSIATKSWKDWQAGLDIDGKSTVNPAYYLTANESDASNLVDLVSWGNSGGHINASGGTYQHLYNKYHFDVNNVSYISWMPTAAGTNIASLNDLTVTVMGAGSMTYKQFKDDTDVFNPKGWYYDNVAWTAPDGTDTMHTRGTTIFANGVTYKEDYYTIDDNGKTASRADYNSKGISAFNEEMVLSGSEFKGTGGKIDLCVEPKIFIDAGLLK